MVIFLERVSIFLVSDTTNIDGLLRSDPMIVAMVAHVSSLISDLELQLAKQFHSKRKNIKPISDFVAIFGLLILF